jgi:hypothetical protein
MSRVKECFSGWSFNPDVEAEQESVKLIVAREARS